MTRSTDLDDPDTPAKARLEELAEPFAAGQERAVAELERADAALRVLCREHPLATLAGATLAGFVLGRLLSRRR